MGTTLSSGQTGRFAGRATVMVFGAGLGLAFAQGAVEAAGPECQTASAEFDRAQATLSKAMRDSDVRANAYSACMQSSGSCTAQKAAYDAALAARSKATAALKAAATHRKAACN